MGAKNFNAKGFNAKDRHYIKKAKEFWAM